MKPHCHWVIGRSLIRIFLASATKDAAVSSRALSKHRRKKKEPQGRPFFGSYPSLITELSAYPQTLLSISRLERNYPHIIRNLSVILACSDACFDHFSLRPNPSGPLFRLAAAKRSGCSATIRPLQTFVRARRTVGLLTVKFAFVTVCCLIGFWLLPVLRVAQTGKWWVLVPETRKMTDKWRINCG